MPPSYDLFGPTFDLKLSALPRKYKNINNWFNIAINGIFCVFKLTKVIRLYSFSDTSVAGRNAKIIEERGGRVFFLCNFGGSIKLERFPSLWINVKILLCDCPDGWVALDISHSCRRARKKGKALIKVFIPHPWNSFLFILIAFSNINFDCCHQVTGLISAGGSYPAFLQTAESAQVASLDILAFQPSKDLYFRHEYVVLAG